MKLKPKCFRGKEVAFVASGYFMPCCQIDGKRLDDFKPLGFMDDKFYIDNISDVKTDVLESPEWIAFYDTLINDPVNAPQACKNYCSEKFKDKQIIPTKNI